MVIEKLVRERERERIEIVMRNGYRLKILNCQRHFLVRYFLWRCVNKGGKTTFWRGPVSRLTTNINVHRQTYSNLKWARLEFIHL